MATLVNNVCVILGLASTYIILSNAANVTTDDDSKVTNERHRRLIPYMTFYYGRQQFGQQPSYQQLSGATSYASNSLLSNAGTPFKVKAIPYHTKLVTPIGNNLYSTKIVSSTGSNLFSTKPTNNIISSNNLQYSTNTVSPAGNAMFTNSNFASLVNFLPPSNSVNPSNNLQYYPTNSIGSTSKTLYPTSPTNGIVPPLNFQYPTNNIALLGNIAPPQNVRFPGNSLHATIRYVPRINSPPRSYTSNNLLFTSSLPYSSRYSFPSANRATLTDSLRNINTRVPFVVTNSVPPQVYSTNQLQANVYQQQANNYPANHTPAKENPGNQIQAIDYAAKQVESVDYPNNHNYAADYPANQAQSVDYSANENKAADYPTKQNQAEDYAANHKQTTDYPLNQDEESNYPTSQAEDYPTNQNRAPDYPANQVEASNYPADENQASNYPASHVEGADYPTNQIQSPNYPASEEVDYPPPANKEVLQNVLTPSKTPLDNTLSQILALLQQAGKLPSGLPVTTPHVPVKTHDESEDDYTYYDDDEDVDIPAVVKTITKLSPATVDASQLFYPGSKGGTPGRPGVDYPILAKIPPTSFDCKNQRYKGFFGDPDTNCQVWHYCDLNGGQASFLCPNGTIFSQVGLTCDWWFNVRCDSTVQLYVLNERLYKYILPATPSFPEDYSGPVVDRYLTLKFQEKEEKRKQKELDKEKELEKELKKEQEKEQETKT